MAKRWTLWRIRSPWLRIPVAWAFLIVCLTIYAAVSICHAIWEGVREVVRVLVDSARTFPWRVSWEAATTWRQP